MRANPETTSNNRCYGIVAKKGTHLCINTNNSC